MCIMQTEVEFACMCISTYVLLISLMFYFYFLVSCYYIELCKLSLLFVVFTALSRLSCAVECCKYTYVLFL
jgi:hypothetical protein